MPMRFLPAAVLALLAAPALAQVGGFQPLGILPGASFSLASDVSANGSVVVGTSGAGFIWRDGRIELLGNLLGVSHVSADGRTIGGLLDCRQYNAPYNTTSGRCPYTFNFDANQTTILGRYIRVFEPSSSGDYRTGEQATNYLFAGMSADGRAAAGTFKIGRVQDSDRDSVYTRSEFEVGGVWRNGVPSPFTCVPGTDYVRTGFLGQPLNDDPDTPDEPLANLCPATGMANDGGVVVGTQNGNVNTATRAVVWTGGGSAVPLSPPVGFGCSGAGAVSGDGSTVLGSVETRLDAFGRCSGNSVPVSWVGGVVQQLGMLPGFASGSAFDASYDGSVIVGTMSNGGFDTEAFVWTATSGMVNLRQSLLAAGAQIGNWASFSADAISDDGTWIVGSATNPDGRTEAWRARVPLALVPNKIVVNLRDDRADANPGDGLCDVDPATEGEQCTLRAALQESAERTGRDEIGFDIDPADGPVEITIESELPPVDEAVVIDGRSQSGDGTPVDPPVKIKPRGFEGDAFRLRADSSIVRGLAIGGFTGWAFRIEGDANLIAQNAMGVGADGVPAPNRAGGVLIDGGSYNQIGGPGAGNQIAFNGLPDGPPAPGVAVTGTARGNAIRGNAIRANTGLGIDLGADGPTPNDAGDADDGPNGLLNAPVFFTATPARTLAVLDGTAAALDLYSSAACDPSGFGEGATYVGSAQPTPSGDTPPRTVFTWNGLVSVGEYVAAAAVAADGSTSEFSRCVRVADPADVASGPLDAAHPSLGGDGITASLAPARAGAAKPIESGTVFLTLHRFAPSDGPFAGTAMSPSGAAVTPDAVALNRYWAVGAFGLGASLRVCLDLTDVYGIVRPEALVLVQRSGPGAAWVPFDSSLEGENLCASGVAAEGEIAVGGALADNPLPEVPGAAVPAVLALRSYPNPARGSATVEVSMPEAGVLRAEVVDALGRRVAVLHDGPLGAGTHALRLEASRLPAGVYVVRASAGGAVVTRRLTVVR